MSTCPCAEVATRFVKNCVAEQSRLAVMVARALGKSGVFLYVNSVGDFPEECELKLGQSTYRYRQARDGEIAVLSVASQASFDDIHEASSFYDSAAVTERGLRVDV